MQIPLCLIPSIEHTLPGHPESPHRFRAFSHFLEGPLKDQLSIVEPQKTSDEILALIHLTHHSNYIGVVENAMEQAPVYLDYGDTYATPASYECALNAVAGALAILDPIQQGTANHGFALVRPPGHHANQYQAGGFCIFNNIAIGAKTLQKNGYAKVTIYDFDVHHGNGTQDIFEEDPDVLYISTHQAGIYPGTGRKHEVGKDGGEGFTINIPLPGYSGDQAFLEIFDRLIGPALERFNPDFLLISAGFDAHWSDPLANLQLTTSGYYQITQKLIQSAEAYCEGRLAFILEGGYDPEALADNIDAVLHALANQPPPSDRLGPAPIDEPNISQLVENIRDIHSL